MEHVSGLARDIRMSLTSEQFDLAGYSEIRVKDLVQTAFGSPLTEAKSMIRFTFIVGGGKLVRSRYDEDLTKWFTSALREIGYVDDKSAAETLDSQGTYKQQHDTGQNLKYVIVFPRIELKNSAEAEKEAAVDTSSPVYIVTMCDMAMFQEIVPSKTPSWRQKKKLLKVLQDSQEAFQAIEAKLVSGSPLTPDEQSKYDNNTGHDADKITWLQGEIKKMVESGQLTASEKEELVASLVHNVDTLQKEVDAAAAAGKSERVKNLEEKKQAVLTRKANIEKISPIQHRLKNGADIQKLRVRLIPLLSLEDKGRSMSLTLADLKSLEEKSELEQSIADLENASRGWFEEESDFKTMCDWEAREAKVKAAKKAQTVKASTSASLSKSGSAFGGSKSSMSGWATVGTQKKSTMGSVGSSNAKKSGFAAAFDDDSD